MYSSAGRKTKVTMDRPLVFLGILCFLIAVGMGISSLSFAYGALHTKGTVINIVFSLGASREDYPIVRYQVDGKTYQIRSAHQTTFPPHSIGEEVTVLYWPEQPHKGRIYSFSEQWLPPLLLGGLGLVCAIVGFKRLGARS